MLLVPWTICQTDTQNLQESNTMETIGKEQTIGRTIDTFEGGYVNNPSDKGGPTNMGITLQTLRQINPDATIADIKNLSRAEAISIYDKNYWQKYAIVDMPEGIQDVVFDTFVQHNPQTAIKLIQSALNSMGQSIEVDGKMGSNTLKAINTVNTEQLRGTLLGVRRQYYENKVAENPSQQQFLKGWLNRLDYLT